MHGMLNLGGMVHAPRKIFKKDAVRVQLLCDMVDKLFNVKNLIFKGFMNHMMSHHSYISLCSHTNQNCLVMLLLLDSDMCKNSNYVHEHCIKVQTDF